MKKTKRLINTFIILIILLGLLTSVTAATGKSFCNWQYNGGLIGPFAQSAYTIRNMLGVVGYTATDGHNSGWNIRDKLYINETKVYYMFGHSGAGHQGCEPGYLTISTTDAERAPISTISSNLSMVKLLYFQGCHTGEFDPVQNSCLDTAAYNKGADSTVAFMEQTTYYDPYTTNYGITAFDYKAFIFMLAYNYSVYNATTSAKTWLYYQTGEYCGADSVYVFGGPTTIS